MEVFFDKLDTLNKSFDIFRINREKILQTYLPENEGDSESDYITLQIDKINLKMKDLSCDIDELQHFIDSNQKNKTKIMKLRIREIEENKKINERNDKIIKTFLPYMMHYASQF